MRMSTRMNSQSAELFHWRNVVRREPPLIFSGSRLPLLVHCTEHVRSESIPQRSAEPIDRFRAREQQTSPHTGLVSEGFSTLLQSKLQGNLVLSLSQLILPSVQFSFPSNSNPLACFRLSSPACRPLLATAAADADALPCTQIARRELDNCSNFQGAPVTQATHVPVRRVGWFRQA